MPAIAAPTLADDELADMLSLIKGADSVELKLTIPETSQRETIEALGIDPVGAQVRLVHFYDTPDLALEKAGVVVRARRVAQKGDDSVVKLRPVQVSASLKGTPRTSVRDVAQGNAPLRKLFSKDQRAFFAEHAPEGVGFEDLSLLGPIFVLKLKGVPEGFARKMVVELWLYPDGARILELSTKCAPAEAFQVAAEGRAFLAERNIGIDGDAQTTKTRKALEFFSEQLKANG
jgi:hypothetical protein